MTTRFDLPGLTLPLNFIPHAAQREYRDNQYVDLPATGEGHDLFKNALDNNDLRGGYVALPLTTLREITMMQLMNQLTDKPDWHKKVFDESIAARWKSEALAEPNRDITQSMIDWCIEELRYKVKVFEETKAVSVYNGDVIKSDLAVPQTLREDLKKAAISLENLPDWKKDWHPGSDDKVLDLVHPSLFPLIYGRSRVLNDSLVTIDGCIKRSGEGKTIPVPPDSETKLPKPQSSYSYLSPTYTPFSKKFQWLPCDVDISGGDVRITSYINNLHPEQHKELYGVIEKIIACAMPLWNLTLTPVKARQLYFNRIPYDACEYDPDPESWPKTEGPQQQPNEDDNTYSERREEWIADTRRVVLPEPGKFEPPPISQYMKNEYYDAETGLLKPEKSVDLRRDYGERGLQIIVKLANIHLTPEKPDYAGGTWHVEGQLNEHICATAIYYYDSVNITTSRLGFRQQSDTETASDVSYEQEHHDWLMAVFGCEQQGSAVQNIGTVDTIEGRMLTWPNILQHQVQPFKLADPSKPGHRKIIALFLVDPNIRIISTANVPPQQREWWRDAVRPGMSKLPAELQDHVVNDVEDFPISLEDAKALRLELMEERKAFVLDHDNVFADRIFSLCEH